MHQGLCVMTKNFIDTQNYMSLLTCKYFLFFLALKYASDPLLVPYVSFQNFFINIQTYMNIKSYSNQIFLMQK